jgi:stage II sporulation protein R
MKKYVLDIILAIGIILSVLTAAFRDFSVSAEEVQSEVLRLHIPANSDSDEDQRIKLALRDYILEKYSSVLSESADLREAEQTAEELLPEIESDCCEFLRESGADYGAKAELVTMYFTTRTYDTVTLPAGDYTALRITLGSGEGRNWWCVMFPPLCLAAASDGEAAYDDVLSPFAEKQGFQVKFALYELLKGLFE